MNYVTVTAVFIRNTIRIGMVIAIANYQRFL